MATLHADSHSGFLRLDYLDLKTFTHTIRLGEPRPAIMTDNMQFVFIPTNNPRNHHDIKLLNTETLQFDNLPEQEGIIVQCIGKYKVPSVLLKPIYFPAPGQHQDLKEWERKEKRRERINNYHKNYESNNPDYKEALTYFDVAAGTGMYFGVFDALLGLICHPIDYKRSNEMKMSDNAAKHLAHFYKQYVEQGKIVDNVALWRMADEFLFDWCLIPKSEWDKVFDDLTPVKELLKLRHKQVDWLSICLKDRAIIQNQSYNIILRTSTNSFGKGRNPASFWQLEDVNERVNILKALSEIKYDTISRYIQVNQ